MANVYQDIGFQEFESKQEHVAYLVQKEKEAHKVEIYLKKSPSDPILSEAPAYKTLKRRILMPLTK